jgi:hypothetical protein
MSEGLRLVMFDRLRLARRRWLARCCAAGLLVVAPATGLAAAGPRDVANAVLAQVAAQLPGLVKGKGDLSGAANVPMLQDIATQPLDNFNDLTTTLRLPADASLLQAFADDGIDDADDVGNGLVYWVQAANLGAVNWQEGTAECDNWEFFTARGGHAVAAPAPAVLTQGLCAEAGQFGGLSQAGRYVVATSVVSPDEDLMTGGGRSRVVLVVAAQVWDGAAWTAPQQLQAVLDYPLAAKPAYEYCPDEQDCPGAVQLGLAVARKFEGWRKGDFMPMKIAAADQAVYKRMLAISQTEDTESLPTKDDDAQPETVDWDFGDASTQFPAYLNGELVLGRIGHGQLAWRQNDAWNVGFWALDDDGKDLDDVAGLIFERDGPVLETVTMGGVWVAAGK